MSSVLITLTKLTTNKTRERKRCTVGFWFLLVVVIQLVDVKKVVCGSKAHRMNLNTKSKGVSGLKFGLKDRAANTKVYVSRTTQLGLWCGLDVDLIG